MPTAVEQKSTSTKSEKKKMPAAAVVESKTENGLSSPVVETKKRKRPSKEKPQKSIEVEKDENDLQPAPAKKPRKSKKDKVDASATKTESNKLTGVPTPNDTNVEKIESSTSEQKKASKKASKKRKHDKDDPIPSTTSDSDIAVSNPKKVRNVLPANSDLKQNKQKQALETDKLKESMSILQKQQHDTQQQNLKHYKEQSSEFSLPQVSSTPPAKVKQISIPATASAAAASAIDDMDAVDMANVCM